MQIPSTTSKKSIYVRVFLSKQGRTGNHPDLLIPSAKAMCQRESEGLLIATLTRPGTCTALQRPWHRTDGRVKDWPEASMGIELTSRSACLPLLLSANSL